MRDKGSQISLTHVRIFSPSASSAHLFSPIGLPPLNAEGEGELWEMGGGQMDTKSPKPMTTYSRRIFTPVNGKLVISAQEIQEIRGDFVCGMNEVFFRLHFPFLRNSSWKRDLRVD